MIFFDASAAAKRYFRESGSERMSELWEGKEVVASLIVLHCELTSVVNRKLRERALTLAAYRALKEQIQQDISRLHAVPIDAVLIGLSLGLLDAHPLKALDSLYLAGALSLLQSAKGPVLFVSADRQLLRAARAEGLPVLDPERR